MDDSVPNYYRYWGKADADGAYHLLPYHCLDVAAVGWYLLDPKEPRCICIAAQLGVEPDWLRSFFVFCLTLHDLGKFARAFQGLRADLSSDLVKACQRMSYTVRHDTLGFFLWRNNLSTLLEKKVNNAPWIKNVHSWLEIVTGHHGMPPEKSGERVANFFNQGDENAAFEFVRDACHFILGEFDCSPLHNKELRNRLRVVSWQLAGLSVLADWQGSNREHFQYVKGYKALPEYWDEEALPSAKKAVQSMPEKPKQRQFFGISDLFSFIQRPSPLQQYAISEHMTEKPQLFILEDITGAGKTEAALILTHRMLGAGLADGVYIALPTMATANAMYIRLGNVYRRFYGADENPSLILAHGARDLSDAFKESVLLSENQPEVLFYSDGDKKQIREFSATAFCNAWLADNRKKALLADVGVGTIDQALLGVLPVRHQSLRLLGLRRKVLLVDEVHAYDLYMLKLLETLIEFHSKQGGSVILLSATLPKAIRENLVAAFQKGLGSEAAKIENLAYPLATHITETEKTEQYIDTRGELKRSVTVTRLENLDAIIEKIAKSVKQEKCVCWIRNTVREALNSYQELAGTGWLAEEQLHLFHSRYAMADRQRIETDVLARFGKNSDKKSRSERVLVATQVVEQSLDLDFDVMVTDLAPIDLIIQRAGRLCRHIRDINGNRIEVQGGRDQREKPVLYILAPLANDDVDQNWLKKQQPGTQAVYPHVGQLWLTARQLFDTGDHGQFTMPNDSRQLIEGVYSCKAKEKIPEVLLDASKDAIAKAMNCRSMANMNVLKLNKGYTRKSGDWDEENRIPTRLSEAETISVALALHGNGKLIPYAGNVYLPWAMSTVKIPEHDWRRAKDEISQDMEKMINDLKNEEKSVRWLEVFPIGNETAHYYDARTGWQPQGE